MNHFIDLIGYYIPNSEKVLDQLKPYIKERTVRKNEFILQADGVCRKVSFISKGAFYMYRDKEGKEEVTDFHFEGNLTGDYVSFIKQSPAEHSIRALEDCEIEELTHTDLHHLYNTIPLLERVGRNLSEQTYCKVLTRMSSYQNDSPEVRYQNLNKQHPGIFKRVPHYLIAAYLGVTPVGLSKIRKRLHESGQFLID